MTPEELASLGYLVDTDFIDQSPKTTIQEGVGAFFRRVKRTMNWLLNEYPGDSFIVSAHCSSGAVSTSQLLRVTAHCARRR
jgi:hypothetical protein